MDSVSSSIHESVACPMEDSIHESVAHPMENRAMNMLRAFALKSKGALDVRIVLVSVSVRSCCPRVCSFMLSDWLPFDIASQE